MRTMRYAKDGQSRKRAVKNPSPMTVYKGSVPEGEIEDHGPGEIRAWLGIGDSHVSLGAHPDRKAAMRAVSEAAKAAGAPGD
jgi:hypothetical protein